MPKLIGSDGAITINGVTVYVTGWTYTGTKDLGETTEVGDSYKEYKPTMRSGSGSVTFILDPTIATQKLLIEQMKTGIADAEVEMKLYYNLATLDMLNFYALVSSVDLPEAANGVVTATVNYTQTGALLATPTGTVAPILLTAIATDAVTIVCTFDIAIAYQTAFDAAHFYANVDGALVAPTGGVILANVNTLTFPGASFAAGNVITLTITGLSMEDTDVPADTYLGCTNFPVTNSVP
jgi:hypothetical protein